MKKRIETLGWWGRSQALSWVSGGKFPMKISELPTEGKKGSIALKQVLQVGQEGAQNERDAGLI